MHEIMKPGIVLFIITAIAAFLLGIVYNITLEPIEKQRIQTKTTAMNELLPTATSFVDETELPEDGTITSVTIGYEEQTISGYIIGTAPQGYSGTIQMLVAISTEGVVEGVKIIKQTETPGLGANCQLPDFTNRYINKSGALAVTKSGSPSDTEIQAITSATITSTAVTKGVNDALDFFLNQY